MDKSGNTHHTKRVLELSQLQLDALREVATIGMGNAATSLSKMVDKKINIQMSGTELMSVERITGRIDHKNMLVTGVYIRMRGDLTGTSLLFFSRESALLLADLLNGAEPGSTTVLRSMDRSAIGELGSILTASYLNSLSNMLDLKVEISVPSIVFDIASAIVYFVMLSTHEPIRHTLVSKTDFVSEDISVNGEFMFLLNDKSILNMLSALKKKL